MPFKKVGEDDYTGPSGRHFNYNQVRRYYARGGSFEGGGSVAYAKGSAPQDASYAQGGTVLGRTREFLKEPDTYIGGKITPEKPRYMNPQDYGDNKESTAVRKKLPMGKATSIRTKAHEDNVDRPRTSYVKPGAHATKVKGT